MARFLAASSSLVVMTSESSIAASSLTIAVTRSPMRTSTSRREALEAGMALAAAPFLARVSSFAPAEEKGQAASVGWPSYGGDVASSKYSALSQIDRDNFARLKVAWTWRSPDEEIARANPELRTWVWASTPVMADGVLYVTTSMS